MTVLTDFDTVVTSKNQYYEEVKGHQMDNHTMVAFHKMGKKYLYTWQLIRWDKEIVDGNVDYCTMQAEMVDPEGFIFEGEIYKIGEDVYV